MDEADSAADDAGGRRFGRAAQVTDVFVFLAGDRATYLTGELVSVSSQHP